MTKTIMTFTIMAMLCLISSQTAFGAQPGKTDTVFNKRFIPKIKPMMSYGQLAKTIGTPGVVVGAKSASTGIVRYHWDGRKKSALDAKVLDGKVVEATMLAPNGNSYSIGKKR